MFPPHIGTVDAALDFLLLWAERVGGVVRDGLSVADDPGGYIDVEQFHIDFPSAGTVLTIGMSFDSHLVVDFYEFDLRHRDGRLLWREDNHPGHEHEHGGPHHLHIGPEEKHRIATTPVTLADVAEKIVVTHITLD